VQDDSAPVVGQPIQFYELDRTARQNQAKGRGLVMHVLIDRTEKIQTDQQPLWGHGGQRQSALLPEADIGSAGGHVGFVPKRAFAPAAPSDCQNQTGPLRMDALNTNIARAQRRSGTMAATTCCFCGRTVDQVTHLIQGPDLFICDICVDACVDTLATKDHGWRERQIDYLLRLRNRRTLAAEN
jgi:hypothetical protein